ncbi:MAG: ATP-binding protein, partial [Colwellia sp.]|nr:ATP-binding protein [Colwellia sp.]
GELGGVRSSMEPGVWNDINEKMRRYNGLKVYRDGLRVMPYGKQSNDFFEVETRRSKNAGAAHYSLRNMIGAISLTKKYNSNLKDKAGREGFIDNKASKAFRDIIELLLVEVANRYFGRSSKSIRGTFTKPLEEDYQQRKAALDLKEQKAKDKKAFNNNLKSYAPKVIELLTQTKLYLSEVESLEKNSENILKLQKKAGDIGQKILTIKISNAPRTLKGNQETLYREYKSNLAFIQNTLKETQTFLNSELERLKPKEPGELAYSQLQRNAKYIQDQLRAWKVEARGILSKEQQRIDALIDEKNKQYHKIAQPYIAEVESNRMSLAKCLELLDRKREEIQFENEQIFSPYLSTLSSLKESIDLAGLAYFSIDQADEMREEIDRLNSLAQLGITVEIISHELHHMQHDTEIALEKVTDQIKDKSTTENLVRTYRALNEKLKFLSPLKLSGEAERDWISGHEIKDYIEEFYGNSINDINLEFSSKFLTLNVYDEKSRIFPVFINLINNSKYWVKQKDNNAQQILLDIVNDKVVISDDGTGVHEDDIKSLFTIFFTKKVRGGRGVGLHLCRSNLAAAGHTIEYAKAPEYQLLNGANFVINFKGVKYDG